MLLLTLACARSGAVDDFEIRAVDGGLDIERLGAPLFEDLRVDAGVGATQDAEFSFGSFRFPDDQTQWTRGEAGKLREVPGGVFVTIESDGERVGDLILSGGGDALTLSWSPTVDADRARLSFACDPGEPVLGFGSHAQDIDHTGQSFPVWVSEPGIGKTDSEDAPDDWFITGTRHASSFPMPWLLRPERSLGVLADTAARVLVDACVDGRIALTTWEGAAHWTALVGRSPLDVVASTRALVGAYTLPEPWVFGPWNDAVGGEARVDQVVDAILSSGAASTVVWTEDWKGAEELATGYHLTGEWFLSRDKYPNAEAVAADLNANGMKWFAYFSPFLTVDTVTWDQALDAGVHILDDQGEPYLFAGPTFEDMSMVDLSMPEGQQFAIDRMQAALDLGFSGWMADYAEWLPVDARIDNGDPWIQHNAWPLLWQSTNTQAVDGADAAFFVRSGWTGTPALSPVVWIGDQRTDFQPDDGFPTVVPLALGLSNSGVPVVTHDIGGYASFGNPPTTQELWYRWCALGAFSPIMRTHHGAFADDNFQFDTDPDGLAFWAEMTHEHMRLFPYRYGLAAQAADHGIPMLLHPAMVSEGVAWSRMDAWMLGDALLVFPVTEAGATVWDVQLPDGDWVDYWTLEPASSGMVDVPLDHIPVFVRSGSVVPLFDVIPQTLLPDTDRVDLDDADPSRTVLVVGQGGAFSEADGTDYTWVSAGSGTETQTLTSGTVNGLEIQGDVERTYTVVVR